MDSSLLIVLVVIGGAVVGLFGVGISLHRRRIASVYDRAQQQAKSMIDNARRQSDQLVQGALTDAKEENNRRRRAFEGEAKQRRQELIKLENRIKQREKNIERKSQLLEKKERELSQQEQELRDEESRCRRLTVEVEDNLGQVQDRLKRVTNMSVEEAKQELIQSIEAEARQDARE